MSKFGIWCLWAWFPDVYRTDEWYENIQASNTLEFSNAIVRNGLDEKNSKYPIVSLRLTHPTFNVDYFTFNGQAFVSRKMREAMGLSEEDARYFDINSSGSNALALETDYKNFRPRQRYRVVDPDRSDFEMGTRGTKMERWPTSINHLYIREDADPQYDIFIDTFFLARRFTTDRLALRILKAECTGMRFFDPMYMHYSNIPMRYRTLRGVEEIEWGAPEGTEPKLILPIPIKH